MNISALHISATLNLHWVDSAWAFLLIKPTAAATFPTPLLNTDIVIWENVKEETCSEPDIWNRGKRWWFKVSWAKHNVLDVRRNDKQWQQDCNPLQQGWEVTKYKYCVTLLSRFFIYLYLSIYFSDSFSLLLPTVEHKYLHFLLLTFLR